MGADRIKSRKYPGIYYRESTVERFRGRPDRIYWVSYYDARGKLRWFRVGKASQGITEEYAQRKRVEFINKVNLGENPDSRRKKFISFGDVFRSYIEAAKADGKHVGPEENRYEKHISSTFEGSALDEMSEAALSKFKESLSRKGLAPGSIKHVLSLMRRVINFGLRRGYWKGQNPISGQTGFSMPRVENRGERFLSPEEAGRLLNELEKRSQQLHDMALLSLKTGMRATEVFRLKAKDVDRQAGVIYVDAKGGRRQVVYADAEIMAILTAYERHPEEFIFQSAKGQRIREVSDAFNRAVDAIGLNDGVEDNRQKVWFHVLRHTWASWLAQSGEVTLFDLMEWGRWKRVEMVMRYAHLIPDTKRKKLSIIDQKLHGAAQDRPPLRLVAKPSKRRVG